MAFDYTSSAATAQRLIRQFGQKVPVSRTPPGEYDPVAGDFEDPPEAVSYEFDGVVLPADKALIDNFDIDLADGLRIEQFRQLLLAAAGSPFTPQGLDVVTLEGKAWNVLGCIPLNPAGTPIIYRLGIKEA